MERGPAPEPGQLVRRGRRARAQGGRVAGARTPPRESTAGERTGYPPQAVKPVDSAKLFRHPCAVLSAFRTSDCLQNIITQNIIYRGNIVQIKTKCIERIVNSSPKVHQIGLKNYEC